MKITYNWLKEYIDFDWDWSELVERLTMSGLELEAAEDLVQRYAGVVVGRVVERRDHPNADRLSVCRVDIGGAEQTIVCGAPNVAAGQKVPVILPGHSLSAGGEIKKTKIRGVESAGMICSEVELDLGDDASGIMVLDAAADVGACFAEYIGLADVLIDFEVTPNRPDCLSLVGIAREVGALTGAPLRLPPRDLQETGPPTADAVAIEIAASDLCPRYVGRVVRGVQVGPSPAWLQNRLQAVGQRPINNIVDIANYVMLEWGQPLHAFDLARLEEARIVVRRARRGETLETLDGLERALEEDMLVIADGVKPVALAGLMGGANSEVSQTTVDILLESAYFTPAQVRQTRRRLDLQTEASTRFERGADFDLPPLACARAAHLIARLCGGQVARGALDVYPQPLARRAVDARLSRINQLLALDLDAAEVTRTFELLGSEVSQNGDALTVLVPSFRPDLEREVDLIEEVGRIYDYNRIEGSTAAKGPLGLAADSTAALHAAARQRLTGLGLDEVVTNTIVESAWLEGAPAEPAPPLANPPTEGQNALRAQLLPSLLDVARRNFNQRAPTVAVFELGKCFAAESEGLSLTGLLAGRHGASPWQRDDREVDLLDLKGLLESFLQDLDPRFSPAAHPWLRPGHGAEVHLADRRLGHLGQVKPSLCARFAIERPVYIFDLDFEVLAAQWQARHRAFAPLPKFPPIERDLAVVLRRDINTAEVAEHIRRSAPDLIEAVELFDLYEGDQIADGHKSLAFTLRLRGTDRTLEDREADAVFDRALRGLEKDFGAALR